MKIRSDSFLHRRAMPTRCAFGRYRFYPRELQAWERFELSDNQNPHLAWEEVPAGTKSFALVCHDPDAPSEGSSVNQKDRVVPRDLARTRFNHWAVVDLPAGVTEIREGEFSSGVTPGGKGSAIGPHGARQGQNDYTSWFAGDEKMKGTYLGYDGPCPPWNDELIHWYVFTLYALDLEKVPVEGPFTAADVEKAIEGHILDRAVLEGFYYIYPEARFR